ncbi:MAG: glucose-6-phosphate isomerase, partial [bacterium]
MTRNLSPNRTVTSSWKNFAEAYLELPNLKMALDTSKVAWPEGFLSQMSGAMANALEQMQALEQGAVANPDEQRQVGHYWLRAPALAPPEARQAIEASHGQIREFVQRVHSGSLLGSQGQPFRNLLVIGIGGSALGPQFVHHALGSAADRLSVRFLDNTDPDGIDRTLAALAPELDQTLVLVISKSGGTKETRNGMLEAQHVFQQAGVDFSRQAVAITGSGSALDRLADAQGWLGRFPM